MAFIIGVIVMCIVMWVYIRCPRILKLVIFVINCFIPDPVPYIDEIAQVLLLIPRDS